MSNSLSVELGFQIPFVAGILDCLSGVDSKPRIPDYKAKISRIMKSASPYMGRLKRYQVMILPFFKQLFPQVGPVMIKPLREAYENYERMRIEEEAVKADAAESSPPESDFEGLKGQDINANGTQGQWSSKKLMGVSKEIRDMFHDKNKESKPGDEDALSRPMIKTQVLNQYCYEIQGEVE